MYCSDLLVGDLVCIKSWNVDSNGEGWFSIDVDVGTIIEVIEIEHDYIFIDHKIRCFDYVVYWTRAQKIETLPDLIVERFTDWIRRIDGE